MQQIGRIAEMDIGGKILLQDSPVEDSPSRETWHALQASVLRVSSVAHIIRATVIRTKMISVVGITFAGGDQAAGRLEIRS
jgi:hypothetical protein